jgi:hypothetical protein
LPGEKREKDRLGDSIKPLITFLRRNEERVKKKKKKKDKNAERERENENWGVGCMFLCGGISAFI